MLRTDEGIVRFGLEDKWNEIKNSTVNRLRGTFHKHPDWFFTEHDVHSTLYNIAKEELQLNGVLSAKTRDGHHIILVHHEYPTPFRCDMHDYGFRRVSEEERTPTGGLYKRGHYDLVILNPQFVGNNELDVVCGKDYQKFKTAMEKVNTAPLIWVCEVIFFPRVRTIPNDAIQLIEQDALKAKETLRHKVGPRSTCYCKMGSDLVFTGHSAEGASDLRRQTKELEEKLKIEVILSTA